MNQTPAGRIRQEGFTFHGRCASSCEKLRETGCDDAEIGSITAYRRRSSGATANQKLLAKAAQRKLEQHANKARQTVKKTQTL